RPSFNGAVARTRRRHHFWPVTCRAAVSLQWSRRANATETTLPRRPLARGGRLASMEPSRERDGDFGVLIKFNSSCVASMEPSRERDGDGGCGGGWVATKHASMEPSRERDGDITRLSKLEGKLEASMEPSRE